MAIRVLIINRQLAFSVSLKQALERTGNFDVHPFTTSDAAIEYIQSHPQDVALIDFSSATPSGATVVDTLRRIQPGLPIVVSPEQPEDTMHQMNLQASIDPPFSARDIMPLLNSAAGGEEATDLRKIPTRPVRMPTLPEPTNRPGDLSNVQPSSETGERKLRPGEIDEAELRPYMYSGDVFKKRTTTDDLGSKDISPVPSAPRPGEYSTDELAAPSTDVFRRQQSARLRPGEVDPADVQEGTDAFKTPSSTTPEDRPYRPGELRTDELTAPSTDVFREGAPKSSSGNLPPLERPDRQRTGAYTPATPADPTAQGDLPQRNARPGEFSDQDLLNLALNRGFLPDEGAPPAKTAPLGSTAPRPGEITPDEAEQYRISTDVFKEQEGAASSLSPEDAAAMWEQLTREDTPVQPMEALRAGQMAPPPLAVDESFTFDFDDPQETPAGLQPPLPHVPSVGDTDTFASQAARIGMDDILSPEPAAPKSITDMLIEKAQDVALPPDESLDIPHEPVSSTDVLLAAAQELDMPIITSDIGSPTPEATDMGWEFPEDGESDQPKVPTDILNNSRATTEGLPAIRQPEEIAALEAQRLDEQYEVEALSGFTDELDATYKMPFTEPLAGSPPPNSVTDEVNAAYQMPYDENLNTNAPGVFDEDIVYGDVSDEFEPPISAEKLITNYLNAEVEYYEPEPYEQEYPQEYPAATVQLDDDYAGVRRLEEIAAEIRRTRETNQLIQPQSSGEEVHADDVFQRLAAEEPPMPGEEDSGTVGDLYTVVSDPEFQGVLKLLRTEDASRDAAPEIPTPPPLAPDGQATISQSEIADIFASYGKPMPAFTEFDFGEPNEESSAAQVILETALEEQTPPDEFSLPNLIANIERQLERGKSGVKPLPSWIKDKQLRDDLYVREPDFLSQVIADVEEAPDLPQLGEDEQDLGDATTYAGGMPSQVSDMETEWLPAVTTRPARLPEQDWMLEPSPAEDDTTGGTKPLEIPLMPQIEEDEPEFNTEFERLAAFDFPLEDESQYTPPMGIEAIQDPYIAQIALSLTQVSLEDIAGIVLTRENEIMANAGRMSRDEVMEIDAGLNAIWDNDGEQYNIRFITLPSSAKDYMVYSKRTVADLTLSLVFPGTTPLRAIRSQAKRLLEALVTVPEANETEPESVLDAPPASDVRGTYTYLWLLREPESRLSDMIARAIEMNMRHQLEARAWDVVNLRVQDEFVYLVADVPGETPPYEVVRDLKRRAHEIARKQNPALAKADLWADGYLVVAPGRELGEDEIHQFIQFERMAQ
jgi:hypothetical protein